MSKDTGRVLLIAKQLSHQNFTSCPHKAPTSSFRLNSASLEKNIKFLCKFPADFKPIYLKNQDFIPEGEQIIWLCIIRG